MAAELQTQQTAAATPPKLRTLKEVLGADDFKVAIAQALPRHMSPDRFVRISIAALTRTPKLAECTASSVLKCLMDLSMYGLEPDGRRAHLIPFKRNWKDASGKWHDEMECQLIIDYKGLAELAYRSGQLAQPPFADVVCENDEFEYDRGLVQKHKIDFKKPRGAMYAAYSHVRMVGGGETSCVMSKEEIDAIRKRSKAANNGPWVTDYHEMAKKTAFRRHSKMLNLSPEFRDAEMRDDDQLEEVAAAVVSRPLFIRPSGGDLVGELIAAGEEPDEPVTQSLEDEMAKADRDEAARQEVERQAASGGASGGTLFGTEPNAAVSDGRKKR
jgi:recombination protein RecT